MCGERARSCVAKKYDWTTGSHCGAERRRIVDRNAAALCRQLVSVGSVEAFLADHRRVLFPDECFADLFVSGRGRPSIPADVVATVMVLHALEGLSDRDAARALRDRISWKVAAGPALTDEGFDYLCVPKNRSDAVTWGFALA